MATIINNPSPSNTETSDPWSNLLLAIILIIVIAGGFALFLIYALPMIRNSQYPNPQDTNINVTLPNNTTTPPSNNQYPAK